jgi:hypothetical protein
MQTEAFSENSDKDLSAPIQWGQYSLLLHQTTPESTEGTIYFSLPDQADYLYEYEGDLEQALQDLPAIYSEIETSTGLDPLAQSSPLSPEAMAVIEQLWDYFDRTGEQSFQGTQDYNFQIEGDWLLVTPKDSAEDFLAISRDGEIASTFSPQQQGNLMERFAIAYGQIQDTEHPLNHLQDLEMG